jgi:hypothetical protein
MWARPKDLFGVQRVMRATSDAQVRHLVGATQRSRVVVIQLEERARRAAGAGPVREGALLAVALEDRTARGTRPARVARAGGVDCGGPLGHVREPHAPLHTIEFFVARSAPQRRSRSLEEEIAQPPPGRAEEGTMSPSTASIASIARFLSARRPLLVGALGAAVALLNGCSTTSSSDVATADMHGYFVAELFDDEPARSRIGGLLQKDDNPLDSIRLEPGDTLTAWTDTVPAFPLTEASGNYNGPMLPELTVSGTLATVSFMRKVGASAPSSTVLIPPRQLFTTPDASDVPWMGGEGTLKLTWSNPMPGAIVDIMPEPCDGYSTITLPKVPDTGAFDLKMKDLVVGAPTSSQCVSLIITRTMAGKADPAFRAGTRIQATRQTRFTLQIVP